MPDLARFCRWWLPVAEPTLAGVSGFLCTYGPPGPSITCCTCRKRARMVPARGHDVTTDDVARYRGTHVHGTPGSGWDVEDRDDAETVR